MRTHRQVSIACPPAALWRCLTEFELQKRWLTDLVDETPEDPAKTSGVGAASRMRIREGSKVNTYRSVVTAWEPNRRLAVRLTEGSFAPGMAMDVTYTITAAPGGCLLDFDVEVPLKGILFKLMAPLIWIMSAANARRDLGKLATLAPTATP